MIRNEKTSKAVASKAAKVLQKANTTLGRLAQARGSLSHAEAALREAEDMIGHLASVAASALTQAPDRKRKAGSR